MSEVAICRYCKFELEPHVEYDLSSHEAICYFYYGRGMIAWDGFSPGGFDIVQPLLQPLIDAARFHLRAMGRYRYLYVPEWLSLLRDEIRDIIERSYGYTDRRKPFVEFLVCLENKAYESIYQYYPAKSWKALASVARLSGLSSVMGILGLREIKFSDGKAFYR